VPRGEQTIVVNASPAHMFDVITDYPRYPEFTSGVFAASIDSIDGDVHIVTFDAKLVRRISYTLRLVHDRPRKVEWSLIRAPLLKSNNGHWILEPLPGDRTEVRYLCELGIGALIPKAVSTRMVAVSLPSMLREFKQRAESTFRS